jgi:hypothetical protein
MIIKYHLILKEDTSKCRNLYTVKVQANTAKERFMQIGKLIAHHHAWEDRSVDSRLLL